MSSPAYSPTQLLDLATLTYRNASDVTTATSTQFPASNVGDSAAGTVCKFPTLEAGAIVAQWSSTQTYTVVAILNHNFASDLVFAIEKSSDGVTWSTVSSGLSATTARWWTSFASQTSLWFRLRVTSLGSQAAVPYVGELWVGTLVTLSRNYAWGVRTGRAYLNAITRTTYGKPRKSHKVAFDKVTGVMADALTVSELAELTALVEALKGSAQPFLFIPDAGVATICWVAEYMADDYEAAQNAVSRYDGFQLNVQEIPWREPVS